MNRPSSVLPATALSATALPSIALEVPERLTVVGERQTIFVVRLLSELPVGSTATCRVAGCDEVSFEGSVAQVQVPPNQAGELMVTITLEGPRVGHRREGMFWLPLEARESVHIYGDGAAVYAAEPTQTVGPRRRLMVELRDPTGFPPVLLHDLLGREEVVPLEEGAEGQLRVMSFHAGQGLVVGRCYSSQLHASSRRRLRRMGAGRVHWVSSWDDPQLNQIIAHLGWDEAGEQLVVENLTDYSHTPQTVRLLGGGQRNELGPGEAVKRPLRSGEILHLEVGSGVRRRRVMNIRFEEIPLGRVLCPVFTTEGTRFPFPPRGLERRMVGYSGTWIALPTEVLERLLASQAKQTLDIRFLQDKLNLSLSFATAQRAVVVHSNEDLARGLDLR